MATELWYEKNVISADKNRYPHPVACVPIFKIEKILIVSRGHPYPEGGRCVSCIGSGGG